MADISPKQLRAIKRQSAIERGVPSMQPDALARKRLKYHYQHNYQAQIDKLETKLAILRSLQEEQRHERGRTEPPAD